MKRIIWVFSTLFLLLVANLADSQPFGGSGPRFHSEFKPVVGGWSEYQITAKGQQTSKMKIAVVGKEGNAYWYETVMEGGKGGTVITKMLVSGNPEDQKNIKKLIVKEGNNPPMEIPVEMMQQSSKGQEAKGKVIDKGTETITVPAGKFKTQHIQYQDAQGTVDTWAHKDVSPYGLIKSQSTDHEMVLIGYGTGAKSQITEAPEKFEMPQIPQIPERRPRRK